MSPTAWLASYPKSGNTWIRTLLSALETDSDPDLNSLDAGRGHDRVDRWLGISLSNLDDSEAIQIERRSWASAPTRGTGYHRRKTHHPWIAAADGFPARWQPSGARAIYIARDPRAVAVSWAHHNGITHEEAVESMGGRTQLGARGLHPHQPHGGRTPGSWTDHVIGWRQQSDLPALFLTYEQLSAEPIASLEAIAVWLDITTNHAACERAVERCTFTRLAAHEVAEGFVEQASVDRVFFRRGRTDSWREELSPELIARIEHDHGSLMSELGYLD
jgi:aryl sulfotransferase